VENQHLTKIGKSTVLTMAILMPRVDSKKNRKKKTRGIQLLWGKEHVGPGV
jgi:hypothetical protein